MNLALRISLTSMRLTRLPAPPSETTGSTPMKTAPWLRYRRSLRSPTRTVCSVQCLPHIRPLLSRAHQTTTCSTSKLHVAALNTQKIQFAGYLNRIRRLVNFYWSQNVKNMPNSARATLRRPTYQTSVFVVLSDDGVLESIEIIRGSGSRHMDHAAERAFHLAGPFPQLPQQSYSLPTEGSTCLTSSST